MEQDKNFKIKKSTLYGLSIFIVIVITGIFLITKSNAEVTVNSVVGDTNGDVQKIVLSFKNYNYYPNTVTVKADKLVSISLDKSVSGCLRSFNIPSLGLSKYLKTPQDTLEFTPTKKGTYPFACSMSMGTGTLIVE